MSGKPTSARIETARLAWDERGEPRSLAYDDIYFSCGDGVKEIRYLFLANNGLPERWRDRERFVIGETGFGTGLNFLATWALWREQMADSASRLHFVSVEKYPITRDDLRRAHARWPEFAVLSAELLAAYPPPLPGPHRLELDDGRVVLDLHFGDAAEQLDNLDFSADAWFLDGFDPARNRDMWSDTLFLRIARLSAPGATLGTFTVAGFVRRGLEAAGFAVTRIAGHGRKKQMLHGELREPSAREDTAPWFTPPPPLTGERRAVVIGAGIAGASAAHALARRGWAVTLLEAHDGPAREASGNHVGLAYPFLTADASPLGRFLSEGQRYTHTLLARLTTAGTPIAWGASGVVQLAVNARVARRHAALLRELAPPAEVVRAVDAEEASALLGLPVALGGLHFPGGVWLHPPHLVAALLNHPGIACRYGVRVQALHRDGDIWRLYDAAGEEVGHAPVVVVAAGHRVAEFEQAHDLPLHPVRGQVSLLPVDTASPPLRAGLSYEGYITPPLEGVQVIGATFSPGDDNPHLTLADHRENLEELRHWLPQLAERHDPAHLAGRVSFRCASPDKLPQVGPLPDLAAYRRDYGDLHFGRHWQHYPPATCHPGLFLSAGHGARGLSSAPLAGEYLAALIDGGPAPVGRDLAAALHPARYLIRELRRGTPRGAAR